MGVVGSVSPLACGQMSSKPTVDSSASLAVGEVLSEGSSQYGVYLLPAARFCKETSYEYLLPGFDCLRPCPLLLLSSFS